MLIYRICKNRPKGIWFTLGLLSGGLALLALISLTKIEYYNDIEDTEEEILINKIVIAHDKGESSVKVYVFDAPITIKEIISQFLLISDNNGYVELLFQGLPADHTLTYMDMAKSQYLRNKYKYTHYKTLHTGDMYIEDFNKSSAENKF